jgi:DNA (cytosine-5)-methyltransferase 1
MVFPGYKRTRNGHQVLELRFDNIAGCLRTPGGGSSRQLLVIYSDGLFKTRLLTVREAARLMGVRESYRIEGSYNDGYKAMGDAVAVPVVRYLARHLLAPLSEGWRP